jgi:hypothetical protein
MIIGYLSRAVEGEQHAGRRQIPMKGATPSARAGAQGAAEGSSRAAASGLTPVAGLLTLGATAVVVAIFIALNHVLGITDIWVGFLFLSYWGGVEQLKLERLPQCILGSLVGLLAAYGLQALPELMGPGVGLALALGAIVVLIYCLIMGWWPIAVNICAMLFLTVATIPAIRAGPGLLKLFPALGTGIAYFAAVAFIVQAFTKRSAGRRST